MFVFKELIHPGRGGRALQISQRYLDSKEKSSGLREQTEHIIVTAKTQTHFRWETCHHIINGVTIVTLL